MRWFFVALAAALSTTVVAEEYTQKDTDTTLAAVFKKWDKVSASEQVGLDIVPVEKLRFSARYLGAPTPCRTGMLSAAFATLGYPDLLKTVVVSHCIEIATESGRTARVYVQDVLVPGLERDVKVGDIWVLDVTMNEDQARNRLDNGPNNLAVLRHMAINILNTGSGSVWNCGRMA